MQDRNLGQQFGSYKLIYLIGQGGYALVYKGEHVQHPGEFAAVKILMNAFYDVRQKETFQREIEIVRSFDHPHIVRILESDIDHNPPYMTMEYMQGTLAQQFAQNVPLSAITIKPYVLDIASALHYAHMRTITHFDVKPANMLIGLGGVVKLADFGIAQSNRDTYAPTMSQIAGTWRYTAPEHFRGKGKPASDQYALAVVIYEWLSGTPLFSGTDAATLQYQHCNEIPVPLYQKDQVRIPLGLSNVIMRALEKDPDERYDSIRAFADAFASEVDKANDETVVDLMPIATEDQSTPSNQASEHELVKEQRRLVQQLRRWNKKASDALLTIEGKRAQTHQEAFDNEQKQLAAITALKQNLLGEDGQSGSVKRLRTTLKQRNERSLLVTIASLIPAPSVNTSNKATLIECQKEMDSIDLKIQQFLDAHQDSISLANTYLPLVICTGVITALIIFGIAGLLQVPFPSGWIVAFLLWLLSLVAATGGLFYYRARIFSTARAALAELPSAIHSIYQQQRIQFERERQQAHTTIATVYQQDREDCRRMLQSEWDMHRGAIDAYMHKVREVSTPWIASSLPAWEVVPHASQPVLWLGTFTIPLHEGVQELLQLSKELTLPALITYQPGFALSIETRAKKQPATRTQIVEGIEALIMRLLTMQPPRKVHITLLDPSKWTDNLKPFSAQALRDKDDILGIRNVWSLREDMQEQLTKLLAHIQHANTPVEDIYRVLIILDFSESFDETVRNRILDIVQHGRIYDISTILVHDIEKRLPKGFEHSFQEWQTAMITASQHGFIWQDSDFDHCQFHFNSLQALPQDQQESLNHLLGRVIDSIQPTTSLEGNQWFNDRVRIQQWLGSGAGVQLFLGHVPTQQRPLAAVFDQEPSNDANLLIIGHERLRKYALSMFTNIITGVIAHYPPVRFFGLDLSNSPTEAYHGEHPFKLLSHLFAAQGYIKHAADMIVDNTSTALLQFYSSLNDMWEDALENPTTDGISTYIFIYGLPKLNAVSLRRATEQQKEAIDNIRILLQTILEDGNMLHVHIVMAYDTLYDLQAVFGEDIIQFFGQRVVIGPISPQLAQEVLWRDTIPARLEEGQAYLYHPASSSDNLERFRPYDFPSREWLEWVAKHL